MLASEIKVLRTKRLRIEDLGFWVRGSGARKKLGRVSKILGAG